MDTTQFWSMVLTRLRLYIGQTWNVESLVAVTEATPGTVGGWLANDKPAVGERLIKLWYFLAATGIESPELAEIPSYNRYLGELLTFQVINLSETAEILNVKNAQTVLGVLRGTPPLHPNYTEQDLRTSYDEQLQRAKLRFVPTNVVSESPTPAAPPRNTLSEFSDTNSWILQVQGGRPLGWFKSLPRFAKAPADVPSCRYLRMNKIVLMSRKRRNITLKHHNEL